LIFLYFIINKMRKFNGYSQISNFGNHQPPCAGSNDPLTYCLQDSMDVSFQHGSTGQHYGPRSKKCQLYMAQRCAENWDGFCEYFYQEHGRNGTWPNNQLWPNMGQSSSGLAMPMMTTGEQLLQNTAERKYCTYGPNCVKRSEPFDPMIPNSPQLFYYDSPESSCTPICRVNPAEIENDPVMNHLIVNPEIAPNTLINICNTSAREGTNLSGTRIGKLCDNYFQNINQLRK
jgi:hypothetical protein